jgi:LmbE family N-acetylglucosaminyl deacetylase
MAPSALRLLCVLAHPDDESLGTGGTLARYAAEGIETFVLTATRGERGRFGDGVPSPGPEIVGRTREAELRAAARTLGVREVTLLGYPDGGLERANRREIVQTVAGHIARIRPDVVITFDPDGAYGHPDHIAISQIACAAIVVAAARGHVVSKLYFIAWSDGPWRAYEAALRKLVFRVDGEERQALPWREWAITTRLDTTAVWETVWRAVSEHRTQMAIYRKFGELAPEHQRALWGTQEFYRVFSTVDVGTGKECDLFEGLR